jgi:hypothetical protein
MYFYFLPIIIGFGMMFSCKPNENNDVLLRFSQPMVTFDTVFSGVGSVTKYFTVHNPSNSEITTNIFLAGKGSFYSINVDGESGTSVNNYFKNVTIPKKDSIFVFIKVHIDPKNQNNPFLITDSIVFLTGTRIQDVKLLAYGQDAKYIVADKEAGYKIVAGEHETVRWTKDRPYVVYGWAAIDSLGTLIIEPGTKIYFHHNSGLWAYRYSNLEVEGTKDEPVLFRGDRLESWFDKDYAQWSGIWINEGAEVEINNAIITNARTGVQINPYITNEVINVTPNSLVKIENTIIKNTEKCGVWSMFLNLEMTNCVLANNGASSLQLEGGKYTMKHLTIENHFMQAERKVPACYVSNVVSAYEDFPYEIKAEFINCIITGRNETEVTVNKKGSASLAASFQNCLVKAKDNSEYFINCLRNEDPKFEDKDKLDFRLKTDSPAIGKGKSIIEVTQDILGNTRKNPPDIGAYETQ